PSPHRRSSSRTRISPHLAEGPIRRYGLLVVRSSDSECRHSAPSVLSGLLVCFFFPRPLRAFLTPSLRFFSEELNCLPPFVSDPLCCLPDWFELPPANVVGANLAE